MLHILINLHIFV